MVRWASAFAWIVIGIVIVIVIVVYSIKVTSTCRSFRDCIWSTVFAKESNCNCNRLGHENMSIHS